MQNSLIFVKLEKNQIMAVFHRIEALYSEFLHCYLNFSHCERQILFSFLDLGKFHTELGNNTLLLRL